MRKTPGGGGGPTGLRRWGRIRGLRTWMLLTQSGHLRRRARVQQRVRGLAAHLFRIAQRYPDAPPGAGTSTIAHKHIWAERTAFDIRLVTERIGTSGTICDIGGGAGL